MSRYTVGESHVFVRVRFTRGDGRGFSPLFVPWIDRDLSVEVITARCVESNAVAWEHDPNSVKQHEGFIFENVDGLGARYSNQYPSASYGQLDDSEDRRIRRYLGDAEFLALQADFPAAANALADEHVMHPYTDGRRFIETIARPIWNRRHPRDGASQDFSDEQIESLEGYLATVIGEIERQTEFKVTIEPFSFRSGRVAEHLPSASMSRSLGAMAAVQLSSRWQDAPKGRQREYVLVDWATRRRRRGCPVGMQEPQRHRSLQTPIHVVRKDPHGTAAARLRTGRARPR